MATLSFVLLKKKNYSLQVTNDFKEGGGEREREENRSKLNNVTNDPPNENLQRIQNYEYTATCEKQRKTSRTKILIWFIELRPHVLRGGGLGLLFQDSRLLLYFLFLFHEGKVYENAGKQTNCTWVLSIYRKQIYKRCKRADFCAFSVLDPHSRLCRVLDGLLPTNW